VDTVLCGVVGREPAIEWVVDAFRDAIVPIWKQNNVFISFHRIQKLP